MKVSTPLRAFSGAFPAAIAAVAIGLLLPAAALAQATTGTQVTGTFAGTDDYGDYVEGTFRCSGTPTCTGQYSMTYREVDCSNSLTETNALTITGLNLAQTGSLQGTMAITLTEWMITFNPDRTCTYQSGPRFTETLPYAGSWNLASRSGVMNLAVGVDAQGKPVTIPFSFTADVAPPAPVFPMTVTSNINAVTATAAANVQFRAQDVGTSGRVYVFAVAPASQVKAGDMSKAMVVGDALYVGDAAGTDKADPTPCVMAQVNASGQLQAATPAQLQAALSGVLTSAGATVPILTNASTPAVAGSTFYVGYGTDSSAMLTNGIYRNAVTVPGATVCPMVSSQTALWWNPAESGWGLNLNHQGNILFGTLFTYDASRAPLWLVMDNGKMQSDGLTFTGPLYRTTGPAFNASPFNPAAVGASAVGSMTVSFQDVNSGTLRYTVNGVEVAKAIQRQIYGSRAAACFPTTASRTTVTNYQDLWWNPAESGWGVNVTHQDNTLFATLFTYDASGRDLWLVMDNGTRSGTTYSGALYRTSGPPFNSVPFNPSSVGASQVGTMSFSFANGNTGTLTYTYNGAPVTKTITRQVFSTTVPLCY